MVDLLSSRFQEKTGTFSIVGRSRLPSIQRLGTHLTHVIDAHKPCSMALGNRIQPGVVSLTQWARRIGARSRDASSEDLQRHIKFSNQRIEQPMAADQTRWLGRIQRTGRRAWDNRSKTIHHMSFLTTMRRMLTPLIQRLSDCHVQEKPKPRRLLTQCT
jgi:hypothetical protein